MQPVQRRISLIVLLLLGLVWIVLSRTEAGTTTAGIAPIPARGFLTPDFSLTSLTGETIALSDLRGRAVLLNFWASWCTPCRAEMPAIQAIHADYAARGLVVLAVNVTAQDSRSAAESFAAENALTFPILLDEAGDVNRLYQVDSLPTTFFIGPDGVIREIVIGGPMSEASLRIRAESLLEDLP